MKISISVVVMAACAVSAVYADRITVHNETKDDMYAAVYYYHTSARRMSKVIKISAGKASHVDRPGFSFKDDRELVFDYEEKLLAKRLSGKRLYQLSHKNVGLLKGDNFYVVKKNGVLKAHGWLKWKLVQFIDNYIGPAVELVTDALKEQIKNTQPAVQQNPYKDHIAHVRIGNELPEQEREAIVARKHYVADALEQLLGRTITHDMVPNISLVASGGGYRALSCTLGWLNGAQTLGVLDTLTYIAALSGSSWALSSWIVSDKSIDVYKEQVIPRMADGLWKVTPHEMKLIADAFMVKIAYDQPITLVDLYGALLGDALLASYGDERQYVHYSDCATRLKDGCCPFPICTAIRAEQYAQSEWYEFTPYEVGGSWLGMYVPTWAYGRKFSGGESTDFAPEQSLGFSMGTFGSGFGAKVSQLYTHFFKDTLQSTVVGHLIERLIVDSIGHKRLTCAEINNFTSGMHESPIGYQDIMKMVDAGADPGFNLPYPPLSGERPERKTDMIIFIDMTAHLDQGDELHNAEMYARAHDLPFPEIDYTDIDKRAFNVFVDEDPNIPIVVYMPRVLDKQVWERYKDEPWARGYQESLKDFDVHDCVEDDFCKTSNFTYSAEQATMLSNVMEFNVQAHAQELLALIDDAVSRKEQIRIRRVSEEVYLSC